LEDFMMEMRISWQINEEVNKEFSSGRFCIQEVSLMFCGSSCVSERLYCTLLRLHSVQRFSDADMCKELILCVRFLNSQKVGWI
jgi:hypothetical protein